MRCVDMKKKLMLLLCFLVIKTIQSQVTLNADGPGNTYELITSVLAPGHNPIEAPDCNHPGFGRHISEVFDATLNTNVFKFDIHKTPDNDRCINFDRQRNEIKSYDQSPDNLLGIEGESVEYKWKFKLDAGFQSSSSFTHLHQLKAVGGTQSSMPLITLTTRKGSSNDKLQLRYAESTSQITIQEEDLTPFLGEWVEVIELVDYGEQSVGTYSINIKKVSDNTTLFNYSNSNIRMWKTNADFIRPKWGIYRSLNQPNDLRDEAVLYANFSIEEIDILSTNSFEATSIKLFPNPVKETLSIYSPKNKLESAIIYTVDGRMVDEIDLSNNINTMFISTSELAPAVYFIHLLGGSERHLVRKFVKN